MFLHRLLNPRSHLGICHSKVKHLRQGIAFTCLECSEMIKDMEFLSFGITTGQHQLSPSGGSAQIIPKNYWKIEHSSIMISQTCMRMSLQVTPGGQPGYSSVSFICSAPVTTLVFRHKYKNIWYWKKFNSYVMAALFGPIKFSRKLWATKCTKMLETHVSRHFPLKSMGAKIIAICQKLAQVLFSVTGVFLLATKYLYMSRGHRNRIYGDRHVPIEISRVAQQVLCNCTHLEIPRQATQVCPMCALCLNEREKLIGFRGGGWPHLGALYAAFPEPW